MRHCAILKIIMNYLVIFKIDRSNNRQFAFFIETQNFCPMPVHRHHRRPCFGGR